MVTSWTTGRATIYAMPSSGELATKLRESRGLSQRAAAKQAGLARHTVINLEHSPLWSGVQFSTLQTLARTYEVPISTMVSIAAGKQPETRDAHRIDPRWVALPLRDAGRYGDSMGESLLSDNVYVPIEHLNKKGVTAETAHAYRITGSTFMSEEARQAGRIRVGDCVVIDPRTKGDVGSMVLAYWREQSELVVLVKYVKDSPVIPGRGWLRRLDPSSRPEELPSSTDLEVLGSIVWRGG